MESTSHILIYCDAAMSCWNKFDNIYLEDNLDFTVWIERNMDKLPTESFCLLLTICWMLWHERNNRVWNNALVPPIRIFDHAASFLETWRSVQANQQVSPPCAFTTKWQAPPSGYLKLNVDAANDVNSNSTGLAFLLRDCDGSFHAALQMKCRDALLVVEGIKNSNGCSSFDLIMSDIRVLANNFRSLSFVFAKRSANKAAHLLARDALLIADPLGGDLGDTTLCILIPLVAAVDDCVAGSPRLDEDDNRSGLEAAVDDGVTGHHVLRQGGDVIYPLGITDHYRYDNHSSNRRTILAANEQSPATIAIEEGQSPSPTGEGIGHLLQLEKAAEMVPSPIGECTGHGC
nr:uncharacterized protein LOC109155154 [Ipomoea trifida]